MASRWRIFTKRHTQADPSHPNDGCYWRGDHKIDSGARHPPVAPQQNLTLSSKRRRLNANHQLLPSMARQTAVVATTSRLPNGFQHTREGLEELAIGFRDRISLDPFLNQNHLETAAPIAKQLNAYVAPLDSANIDGAGEYALYVEYEVLPEVDAASLQRFFDRGGFSIAFFGDGIGCDSIGAAAEMRLVIGLPADRIADIETAMPILDELRVSLPDANLDVRRYHEHALEPSPTVVIVVTWLGTKIADKIFDKVWVALESRGIKTWRQLVQRIKLSFNTPNGVVHSTMPAKGSTEQYDQALRIVTEEVVALSEGKIRRRISISISETWTIETHSQSLDEPA